MVSGYSGAAGDSLDYQSGQQFTTKDQDNDVYSRNCAIVHSGAWWYNECHNSNLNGHYYTTGNTDSKGLRWYTWKSNSMRKTAMKIRQTN